LATKFNSSTPTNDKNLVKNPVKQQTQPFLNDNKIKPYTNGITSSIVGGGGSKMINPFGSLKLSSSTTSTTTSNNNPNNTNSLTSQINEKKVISFK
jgi:hypothetical protein